MRKSEVSLVSFFFLSIAAVSQNFPPSIARYATRLETRSTEMEKASSCSYKHADVVQRRKILSGFE